MKRSGLLSLFFLTVAVGLLYVEYAEATQNMNGQYCVDGFKTIVPDADSNGIFGACGAIVLNGVTNPQYAKTAPMNTGIACSNTCSGATGHYTWKDAECGVAVNEPAKKCDCSSAANKCPTSDVMTMNYYKYVCDNATGQWTVEKDKNGKEVKYTKDGKASPTGSYFKWTFSCNGTKCVYQNNGVYKDVPVKVCGFKP